MDYSAIFHRSMSEYAHAVDETHYIFRLRTAPGDLKQVMFYYADRAEMSPRLKFSSLPMYKVRQDKYYDYYEVFLETGLQRIAYYFELIGDGETAYYLGDCFSKTPEVERFEYFQLPFNLRADRITVPDWAKDAIVYNIFPDSFANGRRRMIPTPQVAEYHGEQVSSLRGGTLKGIEENLDYIKELGCNCIYLNPFFAASSYHKYDVIDYFHVDPTRGSDEDFKSLVNSAHAMGIRVIIDGVFNHVCYRHPFFVDVLSQGEQSKYYDCFYELPTEPVFPKDGEGPEYTCFAYVPQMPKTNTANPELKEYFCKVGAYWIKEYDIDGWRLDVANELDGSFLRAFKDAVRRQKSDAIVIGEVWENANHYINGSMMDSAMNYDFRRFCAQFFAERTIDAAEFDARITNLLMRYPKQATFVSLNLLDSHDVSRFLTVCKQDRAKMALAILFQMTFVGMPSIFYGDEKGLEGLEESQYRRPMEFDAKDSLEEIYKDLIALRSEYSCLRDGEYETVLASGMCYGFSRTDSEHRVTVYINNATEPLELNIKGNVLRSKNLEENTLKEMGYAIILE